MLPKAATCSHILMMPLLIKEKLVKKNVCTASKKARSKNLTFGGGIFIFHEFNIHQSQKNQYTDYHKYLT